MGVTGPKPRTIPEIIEVLRLNSTFDAVTECYLFHGRTAGDGYGTVSYQGKSVYIHRLVYKYVFGEDPEIVRHSCDTPNCWNPDHLNDGTHADNVYDKVIKMRHHFGEQHYKAKLTDDQVREIRAKAANMSPVMLALCYDVHRAVIHDILKRKTWKHVL